ncbi:ribosome biogenesis ATPase RIX7 [Fimicolochytrium jonesii]|uniref:ribosome biogenesis ATPase RIX7 n=1 Tax=Fimicolochytrium jonesii TaxID=1396493 RepID=UPI0022FE7DCA|nr:ribosome biogenesis ATPase RIX7 [Fimicolochytrium jonesii]KAI8824057.1 ribosome biogenesis ATPase RIX7 [Fimicolochytrium jonesii]
MGRRNFIKPAPRPNGGRSLQGSMEDRMLPLVQEYQYQQSQIDGIKSDVALREEDAILQYIRSQDTTLARKPERNLKVALANVVRQVRSLGSNQGTDTPNDSDEDLDSDFAFEDVPMMEVKETNSMNRSILGIYGAKKTVVETSSSIIVPASPARVTTSFAGDTINAANEATQQEARNVLDVEQPSGETAISDAQPAERTKKRRQKDAPSGQESKKAKRSSHEKATAKWPTPTARLSDLGGMDGCVEEVLQLIGMPLKHPEIFLHLGIQPPRGILLHGPPGCGKTLLAHAIAGEAGVPFVSISAPSIVSGMSGESEKKLREIFDEAKDIAPCLMFIDEIDAITPKRETAQREMERRIVAQLLTCLDDISMDKTDNKPVIVIGATNRPDSIDSALRRAGRFDREIAIGVPDEAARARILDKLCSKLRLSGDLDTKSLAKVTPGYVGADLNALTAEAGMLAVQRILKTLTRKTGPEGPAEAVVAPPSISMDGEAMDVDQQIPTTTETSDSPTWVEGIQGVLSQTMSVSEFLSSCPEPLTESELEPLCIIFSDFEAALKVVQPSAKREGFATVPDVSWADVGALTQVREELRMAIVEPIRHPEFFSRMGIASAMGVLLYGPPGCGKTLLAKAVANESCCNFISVKGPELLNKYVGESERAVRMVFARAQASSPCVIFFDELDALCPARSNEGESQSSSRLVNTLLTEMDGMQGRKQVYVIAATNRPDMIDPAMLRPGRLDKALYVDLPDASERYDILTAVARRTPLAPDVDLRSVAGDARCDGFSGADLAALVREAAVAALREGLFQQSAALGAPGAWGVNHIQGPKVKVEATFVQQRHFMVAFSKMLPSVNKKDRRKYDLLRVKFGNASSPNVPAPPQAPVANQDVDA